MTEFRKLFPLTPQSQYGDLPVTLHADGRITGDADEIQRYLSNLSEPGSIDSAVVWLLLRELRREQDRSAAVEKSSD